MPDIYGLVSTAQSVSATARVSSTNMSSSHSLLLNRDAADQHPISSITDLPEILSGIDKSLATIIDDWSMDEAGYLYLLSHGSVVVGPIGPFQSGNGGSGGNSGAVDAVCYTPQELTEEQKAQARDNIGACDRGYVDDAVVNDLSFDETTGMLYLMRNGQTIGNGVYLVVSEGGDNNSKLSLRNTTGWIYKKITPSVEECRVSFTWSSFENGVSTGPGTVTVTVGDVVWYSAKAEQGSAEMNVRPYLEMGENDLRISVSDIYNNSRTIAFNIVVADILSTKLVERTLSGDYINNRVTTVGPSAFAGLTLKRLVLPNVSSGDGSAFSDIKADEIELSSLSKTAYWMFTGSTIGLVRLPSLTTIAYESLRANYIDRIIFNSIEDISDQNYQRVNGVRIFDFHRLKTLSILPSGNNKVIILRSPEVCALQISPGANTTTTVYVPASLVDSYKAATNWSSMAGQIYAIEDYPEICEVN